jgi:predicted nicotinamide N-methyase
MRSEEDHRAFVRAHTALAKVPLVPEIVLHTASEVTPLWQATEAWLQARGLDVPFWSVPWAGGQALARWVLDHPEEVSGRAVVDFGAGSGLVAIAAALAGAARVVAVDTDPLAAAACALNATANGVAIETSRDDIVGQDLAADVLLAGDVWYERAAAARFEPWLRAVAGAGVRVVTGDPGRAYVPPAARELARYEVPTPLDLESVPSRITRVLALTRISAAAPR